MELRIEHLSKTYPNGTKALDDVTLTIPRGMFGLLGPNGAGKSTLMRTLATLQDADADAGQIHLGDIDVLKDTTVVRGLIGYAPQEFGVYPNVTAEALLDHLAILKGVTDKSIRRERVQALLEHTNLWDVRRRKLGTYSGGMRQRFGIAVALIGSPKLIIVDEPTAGLDPAERSRFLNLLAEIGENAVVILSTHIVDDVNELCSGVAIIDRGRILTCGEPLKLVDTLQNRIWRTRIDRKDIATFTVRYPVVSTKLSSGRLEVRVVSDISPGEEFTLAEPTLTDVYFVTMHHAGRTGLSPDTDSSIVP